MIVTNSFIMINLINGNSEEFELHSPPHEIEVF